MKFPSIATLLPYCLAFSSVASTASSSNVPSATYIQSTSQGNLTFALSAVNDTGETFIHLSGPSAYQWIAIGTGSQMAGSVMLILYKDESGSGVTLSPRQAPGETQPRYSSDIDCKLVPATTGRQSSQSKRDGSSTSGSASSSSSISADIHCTNLRSFGRGSGTIDFTNPHQPFIYALGPQGSRLSSNSASANINQHESYSGFSLDMVSATSASSKSADGQQVGVPSGTALTSDQGASGSKGGGGDKDMLDNAHAAFMLAAFVILFPLGAVLLRYVKNGVKVHAGVQSIALICTVIGGAIGIKLSLMSPDDSSFNDPHQVLGLIIFVLVFVQWGLGLAHHLQFRKYMQPTALGKIHRIVGPFVLLIGFINGFLGFNMSGSDNNNKWLGVVVGVVAIATVGLLGWKEMQKKKSINAQKRERYDMSDI